jgi:hypothetical protein
MANHNKKPPPPPSVATLKSFRAHRLQPTTRLYPLLLILFTLTALLGAYFSYRPVHKTRSNHWWSFGSSVPHTSSSTYTSLCDGSIEGKINDLAKTFGVPPKELASAIAVVVKNYAPPESTISSLASQDTLAHR